MSTRVLFIHGTGTREPSYSETLNLVTKKMPGFTVERCYWAGAHGTQLLSNGASIPRYQRTGGNADIEAELERCRWRELYADPLWEVRAWVPTTPAAKKAPVIPAAGGRTPPKQLEWDLTHFEPSAALDGLMDASGLKQDWSDAFAAVVTSADCRALMAAAGPDNVGERRAIARAIVAESSVRAAKRTGYVVDGQKRDAVLSYLVDELHATGKGVFKDLAGKLFTAGANRLITWKVHKDRGATSDAASPFAADVLAYQSRRGEEIRGYIRSRLLSKPEEPATLVAHSLGGIAAVELLIQEPTLPVHRLVTVGSQAPLLYELNLLNTLRFSDPLPEKFPPWLNIFDPNDFLSYVGQDLFGDRVVDAEVDNKLPFPQSHSGYWSNDAVWKRIIDFVGP